MNSQSTNKQVSRSATLVGILLGLLLATGCDTREEAITPNPLTRDQSPQSKYDRILESLHKSLSSDVLAGGGRFTMQNAAGSGTTVTKYAIDAPTALEEPTAGQSLQVKIKITQSSSYSFLPAAVDKESEESNKPNSSEPIDPLANPLGDTQHTLDSMGVEVLDPSSINQNIQDAASQRLSTPFIASPAIKADAEVVYDLIYEKDRWRLAAPPASDAMEATNIAIEQALKRQR